MFTHAPTPGHTAASGAGDNGIMLSRDILALSGDVENLRFEIERLRTELHTVVEQLLDEYLGSAQANSPASGGDRIRRRTVRAPRS